jgi:hypothetical protein
MNTLPEYSVTQFSLTSSKKNRILSVTKTQSVKKDRLRAKKPRPNRLDLRFGRGLWKSDP